MQLIVRSCQQTEIEIAGIKTTTSICQIVSTHLQTSLVAVTVSGNRLAILYQLPYSALFRIPQCKLFLGSPPEESTVQEGTKSFLSFCKNSLWFESLGQKFASRSMCFSLHLVYR